MNLLTKQEVASIFHCGIATIDNYVKGGILPHGIKAGRRVLWDFEDIKRALEKMKEDAKHDN